MALTSIPTIQTGDEYRDRALMDLINAEREMRSMAEGGSAQMRKLLHTLAFRLAGAQMEELRKTSPNAPDNWKADDWVRFFNQYVLPVINGIASQNGGWQSSMNLSAIQAEMQALRDQVDKQQAQNERLVKDLQAKDAEISSRDQTIASIQRSMTQYRNDLLQSQQALSQLQAQSDEEPTSVSAASNEMPPLPVDLELAPTKPVRSVSQSSDGMVGQAPLPVAADPVSVSKDAAGKPAQGQATLRQAEEGKVKYSDPAFVEIVR